MRPSASGFGFWGAAGCAGRADGCEDEAAKSVRSEGDRSFGFWPRTTSRGSACAGEAAQAVAVTFRPRLFEFSGTSEAGCAGGAAQAVVSLCDTDFEDVEEAVLLGDDDFEEVEKEVTNSSRAFSASSSDSSSDSSSESASESESESAGSSHSSSGAVASLRDA